MKIYTKVNLIWNGKEYVEESSESYEYEGDVSLAKGGGGGGQTTQKSDPWEAQQPYLKDLFEQAQRAYQAGPPELQEAQKSATEAGRAYTRGAETAQGVASGAAGAQRYLTDTAILDPSSNPALQKYIDLANQSTTRAFRQQALPGLRGGAVQAGNVGSSRAGIAEGIAAQGLAQQVGQQTAGLASAGYGQGLQALTQGLALSPQTAALQGARGDLLQKASASFGGVEGLEYEQQRQRLQDYQALISGSFGGTTSAVGPASRTGGVGGALGGAASGAAIGSKIAPGVGTAWGAGLGAVAGYFS